MDSPFIYTRPLQAPEAIGRAEDVNWLASNMSRLQNSLIWEPANTGKRTLINQALFQLKKAPRDFHICQINLFNKLNCRSLACSIADSLFRSFANTSPEWEKLAAQLLPISHPIVTCKEHHANDIFLDFAGPINNEALEEILLLPGRMAVYMNKPIILVLYSFQSILEMDDSSTALPIIAKSWKNQEQTAFVLCGQRRTAYNELFTLRRPFSHFAEQVNLSVIEERLMTDLIVRNFTKAGRVISKDFASDIYRQCEGNPFYCQQLGHFCFTNTKGYLNDAMFASSFEAFLDAYQAGFEQICSGLTNPQLYYLKAITDEVEHFSTAEVLDVYHLNSSANVFRVRTALEKKGVIDFHRNRPYIIDPLFKLWFKLRFCNTYWF